MAFGLFLLSFSAVVIAEEQHTKEYEQWRKNTLDSISLSTRCVQVKKNTKLLANTIETVFAKREKEIMFIESYIEWLREKFIISNRDCDLSRLRVDNIPGARNYSDSHTTKWLYEELVETMKPLDELAYISDLAPRERDKIASAKLEAVKFLHFIVKNLRTGDPRKAMQEVDDFESKYSKS